MRDFDCGALCAPIECTYQFLTANQPCSAEEAGRHSEPHLKGVAQKEAESGQKIMEEVD
jgi:hypothetical protein